MGSSGPVWLCACLAGRGENVREMGRGEGGEWAHGGEEGDEGGEAGAEGGEADAVTVRLRLG